MYFQRLQRALPVAGLVANALRFPGLHAGLRVEIDGPGKLAYGKGVRLGEGTRLELPPDSLIDIDQGVMISRGVHIGAVTGRRVRVGARTTIQDNCRIYGDVAIGRECIFAPNVFLSSGTHTFDAIPHRLIHEQEQMRPVPDRPIRVYDDCWIGINAVLTPGVTIGRGCVLGANSVLTQDLPPYSVAAGNPAQVIRQRLAFQPKARIEAAADDDTPYFYDGFETSEAAARLCDSEFVLALQRDGASTVRLCLSGPPGEITFGPERRAIPAAPDIVEFPLPPQAGTVPFLRFRAAGRCRVRWADLV